MLAAVIVVLTCGVMGQGVPTPEYQVPAIREPHHFVKLDNAHARILDVTVPPSDSTLFHIHENPYFWISIGSAQLVGLTLGTTDLVPINTVDAEVRYSPVVTHRVGNVGTTTFRNITVQIQGRDAVSPAGSFRASPRPTGYQVKPALDNELVYIERLMLEPGQSTGRYTRPRSGLWIAAHDGVISIERPGEQARRLDVKAGDFDWHTGPLTHTITNIGKTRFDAIEAVWK